MQEVRALISPPAVATRQRTAVGSNVLVGALLILIMVAGGYFRYAGLNWDDFTHLHPDERFLTQVVAALGGRLSMTGQDAAKAEQLRDCMTRYPETGGVGPFFDARCSNYNPHNIGHGLYVYGTLPLFIARGAAELMAAGSEAFVARFQAPSGDPIWSMYNGGYWLSYDGIHLVWRFMSALAEMGIIVIVFLIGLRLHDKWVGLLGAALYSLTVFSIQMSHFGTVDSMSNFFAALCVLFAVLVQQRGKLIDYLLFGLAFGCALSSRINLAPLVGLLVLAALVRILPGFDRRTAAFERERIFVQSFTGLILAGVLTIVVFRLANPYAFSGPGIFGLTPNPRWLSDLGTAQALVGGDLDSPPNFQWASRASYLFPLNNMVLWGMGIAFGLSAWISLIWAGWRLLRGKPGAVQNIVLLAWVVVYFGWLGRNWVMTMRYFLPIYPPLAVLAAWGLITLLRQSNGSAWRRMIASLLILVVVGFTALWALMFTNIYRNQLTRVQASHWVWENVPGDFAMQLEGADPRLINIPVDNENVPRGQRFYDNRVPTSSNWFTAPQNGVITTIQAQIVNGLQVQTSDTELEITITAEGSETPLAETMLTHRTTDLNSGTVSGVTATFEERVPVQAGKRYRFDAELVRGSSLSTGDFSFYIEPDPPIDFATPMPLVTIPVTNCAGSTDDLVKRVTCYDDLHTSTVTQFTATADGTISSIHAPRLGDPQDDAGVELLLFTITRPNSTAPVAQAALSTNLRRDTHVLGESYDIPLEEPLEVRAGETYLFRVDLVGGGPVISGGSVFTWEGAWDDPIPTRVCTMPNGLTLADDPPSGLNSYPTPCNMRDPWWGFLNGYTLDIVYEDVPEKRDELIRYLDDSDYIAISSNRFYDTLSRNPTRWPMANRYYDALFSGELGYELAATFQETFEFGPLRVSDQVLPTYQNVPDWLNEFEAEEAFHVYDHPVVFIFKKGVDYDPERTREILYSVPLTRQNEAQLFRACPEDPEAYYCDTTLVNVVTLSTKQVAQAPTQLRLTDQARLAQFSGGTWSERFPTGSIINMQPAVTIIAWWLCVMVFGWAAFPLLFALFPGLADRGYGLSKFAGIFLTAWGTWYLASLRVPVWSQEGVFGGVIVLLLVGSLLAWRKRDELAVFLREKWAHIVGIEVVTLVVFLIFLVIRLTNPDLWHPIFGGEKPMDFAYFNAVLRSSVFPPYDPWNAGGYINYYYFGFVIVGAPVLLLGVVPSVAYNLILPTLAALTGIGAFSVAYNVVSALRERGEANGRRTLGSPWAAGIAALMLAVILGNLDTPRTFLTGVASLGGYSAPRTYAEYLVQEYTEANGEAPDGAAMNQVMQQAANPNTLERVNYELGNVQNILTSLGRGFARMSQGQSPPIGSERWFWGPSRIYSETPGVEGQAITEMPIFTYIYGDLHAHMISMPLQFLAIGFLLNEVLSAGKGRRVGMVALALFFGGICVGMLRATNTWEWITYLILSVAVLAYAWWLAACSNDDRLPFHRRAVIFAALYIGGFLAFHILAALPYTTWFATAYSRVMPWTGGKSPIWAYLSIHGLFLFLVVSLLIWDTGRWLRENTVRSLRGTWLILAAGALIVAVALAASVVLALVQWQVTLIVLPLLVWIVILFFRQGQTRPVQFALGLAGVALALTLGVEYIVLDGDIGRQNTVFKFYLQAWLMLSIVGGVTFSWLLEVSSRWSRGLQTLWYAPLALLVAVAALFPVLATRGKAAFRFDVNQPITLDGAAFMNYATQFEGDPVLASADPTLTPFTLSEDYAMIRWLQENVQGTPTIIEGISDAVLYKWGGRISIHTGLPTVIGWDWHQKQQRGLNEMGRLIDARVANTNAFYHTLNVRAAWDILRFYDVSYVIVGRLERAYYEAGGLAKFDQMVEMGLLEPVYQNGGSTIYRVNKDAVIETVG
jgi:YYY domain-containing protein